MPENIEDFVNKLPNVTGDKRFTSFCTQAAFSGDGNIFFKEEVEKKGYSFKQSFQINITTNFNVAMFPFSLSKPAEGKKLEKIKSKALLKIKQMARKISDNEEYIEGRRFYQKLIGGIQRKFFRRGKKKLPAKFQFFHEKCTKCGLCESNCPTENIVLKKDDPLELNWKDNCLLCFRCYNFCPSKAINYGNKITDPEKYKRYRGPVSGLKLSDLKE
jgi:ferredoxin